MQLIWNRVSLNLKFFEYSTIRGFYILGEPAHLILSLKFASHTHQSLRLFSLEALRCKQDEHILVQGVDRANQIRVTVWLALTTLLQNESRFNSDTFLSSYLCTLIRMLRKLVSEETAFTLVQLHGNQNNEVTSCHRRLGPTGPVDPHLLSSFCIMAYNWVIIFSH